MFVTWMDYAMLLLQGSSVVITASLVLFGIRALRDQIVFRDRSLLKQLLVVLLFSVLAIYGTHAGKVVSTTGGLESVTWSHQLKPNEAVVNFRDMVVVTSGLAAGPWMGVVVGSIAGLERYSLGGFTALSCSLASLLSGLLAGLFRQRANAIVKPNKAAIIGATTIFLQMILILLLAKPFSDALLLVQQIGIPMMVTAAVGCYAFQQVLQGLDKVRLQLRAQRAEIRALHAQIEPHFIMNVLNAIKALIRIDQDKARHYITMLGEFLHETRSYATRDTIRIKEELKHVKKYLDFQALRFLTAIDYHVDIEDPELLEYKVPPRSLLTLIENSLVHGFNTRTKLNSINVAVFKTGDSLIISVKDNGVGITKQEIQDIDSRTVISNHKEDGRGLYHLKITLKELYGEVSNLEINCLPGRNGTAARLIIPMNVNLGDYCNDKYSNC